jgi:hypothetical protein
VKPILFGAALALLWLVFGLPHTMPVTVPGPLLQPSTLAFAAGLYTRPHLTRWRWTR